MSLFCYACTPMLAGCTDLFSFIMQKYAEVAFNQIYKTQLNLMLFHCMRYKASYLLVQLKHSFSSRDIWGGPSACIINPAQRIFLIRPAFISKGERGKKSVMEFWPC